MLVPAPSYLNSGSTAWQLTSAVLVGIMSVPGLAILYGGVVKKKWAVNSAMMVLYAFSMVLVTWMLWGYNMSFGTPLKLGPGILSAIVGIPGPAMSALMEQGQANIPLYTVGTSIPSSGFQFPMSSMVFFQFVFAGISPVLLAGSVLGRMNFKAWMIFVPLWSTFVYAVNAFMLWGGGWLSQMGAVDYSGGYVIHVAAGVSGFVAAAVVGPRILKDRTDFVPNNLIMALAGAGLVWLGWSGFNGGDPFYANADASAAVLNTNFAAATALLTWLFMDTFLLGKPSLVGSINGMVAGLVAITPAAGWVNGWGAFAIGIAAGVIPWLTMNKLGHLGIFKKVDDTLGVVHTHAVAGALGGLMTGLLADPNMIEYVGTGKTPSVSITGLFYGNPIQFVHQLEALLVIIAYDGIMTFILLKLVGLVVPLRASEAELEEGDHAFHGEKAYGFGDDYVPDTAFAATAVAPEPRPAGSPVQG